MISLIIPLHVQLYGDSMRQVVLSLHETAEDRLRRMAQQQYSGKKGSLSKTVEEALLVLEKQRKQRKALERLLQISREDRILGVGRFERNEAYRA